MSSQLTKIILISLLLITFINGQTDKSIIFTKSSSITDALKFVNTPPDKIEQSAKSVKGTLISGELMKLANIIIDVRENKSSAKFESLLSEKSKKNISKSEFAKGIIESIKKGEFLYKNEASRFFVTSGKVSDEEYNSMNNAYMLMPEKPDTKLIFYHFNKTSNFLIGTSFYLIKQKTGYKIVFPVNK